MCVRQKVSVLYLDVIVSTFFNHQAMVWHWNTVGCIMDVSKVTMVWAIITMVWTIITTVWTIITTVWTIITTVWTIITTIWTIITMVRTIITMVWTYNNHGLNYNNHGLNYNNHGLNYNNHGLNYNIGFNIFLLYYYLLILALEVDEKRYSYITQWSWLCEIQYNQRYFTKVRYKILCVHVCGCACMCVHACVHLHACT